MQHAGHVVGMTGDGVNDAPALKQAEVGIAVANATDVTKAAASLVLTDPGLRNIIVAIEASRRIYQRMLTYALNMSIKKLEVPVFLSVALLATGVFPLTPQLMVMLLFANDFATMSITTDNVRCASQPDRWHVRQLLAAATGIAVPLLALLFTVLWLGRTILSLGTGQLRTLMFVTLVFSSQATIYLVRERGRLWASRPGRLVVAATLLDITLVGVLAVQGWLMTPISPADIALVAVLTTSYALGIDVFKTRWFARLGLHAP
jgi:H+-transporting ATPase